MPAVSPGGVKGIITEITHVYAPPYGADGKSAMVTIYRVDKLTGNTVIHAKRVPAGEAVEVIQVSDGYRIPVDGSVAGGINVSLVGGQPANHHIPRVGVNTSQTGIGLVVVNSGILLDDPHPASPGGNPGVARTIQDHFHC
jgi:hypothetical protein